MPKRKLTSDEIKFCERNIKFIKKRNSLIKPKIIYYDYQISHGLKVSMEEEYQKFLAKKKEINEELHRNDLTVIQLQRQIQDGVDVIKEKKKFCPKCGQEETENGKDDNREKTNN